MSSDKPIKSDDILAGFDSATTMLDSLKHSLLERPFKGIPPLRYVPLSIMRSINSLPKDFRQWVYREAGAQDALRRKHLKDIDMDRMAQDIVDSYPDRKYPAVAIGSANGALIHLCSALGIPWLPQTLLVTAKRSVHPDDILGDIKWGKKAVPDFLNANPSVVVHQMHDPVQDRLMVTKVAYLRVKYLTLPPAYREFVENKLAPGAPIIVSDCSFRWPVKTISDRHYFQTGGYGTTSPEEYIQGSDRVKEFLQKQGMSAEKWQTGPVDSYQPEAEWGFVESMYDDIEKTGRPVWRVSYESPEDLSPFAADCYHHWYLKRDHKPETLLVDCFAIMDPWSTMQAHAIPYWLVFNTSVSAQALHSFCRDRTFKRARVILMANGITGIGAVSLDQWHESLKQAAEDIGFVGIDKDSYPNDPASFGSFGKALRKELEPLKTPPRPLQLCEIADFIGENRNNYSCKWNLPG
ncbi:MAG: hypothetical protein GF401_18235 [Chitinivibrionales bacterium]|nr:hypothetical protein [Chitinivibrionales bacterium]